MRMNIIVNSSVDAYIGPAVTSYRQYINETFSAPIDPAVWAAAGGGSIVSGQYVFPMGVGGSLLTVQSMPAGATYTMDLIIPNCPAGNQYFGVCGLQYDFVTNTNAVGLNLFLQCDGTTITGCQVQNNDGLFYINVPLNLLQITGTTVVFPQMKIQILPNYFTLSIAGTQVVNWYDISYQPAMGQFFIYNDGSSGVSLAFDNITITEGVAAWQGLNGLSGVTVLQGGVTTVPLDTKGNGHPEDILPAGTNYAILLLVKGRDNGNRVIDGFTTLANLEGPGGTGEDWDKINDNVGGLIFYGAKNATNTAKFQNVMTGYTAEYAYKTTININAYTGPIGNITPGVPFWQSLNGIPGITVLQGAVLTSPVDTAGHGHPQDILPVGTNYAIILLEKASGALGNFDGFAALQALVASGQDWSNVDNNVGGLLYFGALGATNKAQFQALLQGYGQQYI